MKDLLEVNMSESARQDWRMLYTAAISEGESFQLETMIEDTELAIQQRLREAVDSVSVEAELYAALRVLRRMRAHLLTAA